MVNFLDEFKKMYNDYLNKYTCQKYNSSDDGYTVAEIFQSLNQFISNSVYFSRFHGVIEGKYLNKIHLFLCKNDFYTSLYKHLLTIYFEIFGYESLEELSEDSTFIRNFNNSELKSRNPHYNNKPGMKTHIMNDSNRVVLSVVFSDSTDNDSLFVDPLYDNLLISKSILQKYTKRFLYDSGYESLANNYKVTEKGFEIYAGYNKSNMRDNKNKKSTVALRDDIQKYKGRGISENTFSNIHRYPVLTNNYERTTKSYKGLFMFTLCAILVKKINKIIIEKSNKDIKIKREAENKIKRIQHIKRKKEAEKAKKIKEDNKKIEADKRKKETEHIKKEIVKKIYKIKANEINAAILKTNSYNKCILHKQLKKISKHKQLKKISDNTTEIKMTDMIKKMTIETCDSTLEYLTQINENNKNNHDKKYDKFKNDIVNEIGKDVLYNEIYKILEYKFASKQLYMVKIEGNGFSEENITKIMDKYNFEKKISEIIQKMYPTAYL